MDIEDKIKIGEEVIGIKAKIEGTVIRIPVYTSQRGLEIDLQIEKIEPHSVAQEFQGLIGTRRKLQHNQPLPIFLGDKLRIYSPYYEHGSNFNFLHEKPWIIEVLDQEGNARAKYFQ